MTIRAAVERTCAFFLIALGVTALLAGPPDPPADWLGRVQRQLADDEYEITRHDFDWQAPNRTHGFRTHFTETGIRVVPRSEPTPSWEWSLALVALGRPGAMGPIEPATVRTEGPRVEYDRASLVEWYVNERDGLEQGFTLLRRPPSSAGAPSPVHIEMVLGGTLSPVVATDGQAIDFVTPQGVRVVHYASLVVRDASGHELPAHLEALAAGGARLVRIVFEDGDAAYPVTIDPLATSPAWTAQSDQSDSVFASSVATAGDVDGDGYSDVVVGSPLYDNGAVDRGRAFLYRGSAAGLLTTASWTAEGNAQSLAQFGSSVATAGDVNGDGYSDVVVGCYACTNGEVHEGRVFVYHGSASGPAATASWIAEGQQVEAQFGISVATAGDVNGDGYSDLIVGANAYDNGLSEEGAAFVFLGSSGGLAATATWKAESNFASAFFGALVATAGDINGDGYAEVIVGAQHYSSGQSGEGRVYLYHGSVGGPALSPNWSVEGNQTNAAFYVAGTAGDVNGDGYADVLVGASGYSAGQSGEGRLFLYHGSSSGLLPSGFVESDQMGAGLGRSVAAADVNGDGYADVLAGAPGFDNGELNEGRIFVYHGSSSGISGVPDSIEGGQINGGLGVSLATAGDVNGDGYADVIAGYASPAQAAAYHGSPAGLKTAAVWTAESNQANAEFGFSVATAGDVNGDGYSDVIVGADTYDNGEANEGRAFVYHGSAAGLGLTAAWTAESDQASAGLGYSLGSAGDVNGDGYSDVIVGVLNHTNGQSQEGGAFVYHGSAAGLGSTRAWTFESDQGSARAGSAVGTAGDVNGDGYSDVVVGAYLYDATEFNEGRAFVFHGSPAGLGTTPAWTAESDQASAEFGRAAGTAGDVDGDGYSDVIVGAYLYDNDDDTEGRAFVYHGSAFGLSASPAWTAEGNQLAAQFGFSVATAGDVNGDGFSDVIVGAYNYSNTPNFEGRAFVYHGSAAGLGLAAAWTAESDQFFARFGSSVATAGDVNGDGFSDVAVGAYDYDNGETGEGRAYVYHGSSAGLASAAAWTAESNQGDSRFGWCVGTAGDVDGDGDSELVVGAMFAGQDKEGRAFLYQGNAGRGLSLQPRQRQSFELRPIDHLGASDSLDGFFLALLGRTPFGRGRVRLETEVKPLGTPFDGLGTTIGTFEDTWVVGVELGDLVSGLVDSTPYHWRVRLLYHPASTPFAPHGPWISQPWNGWQETDLLTAVLPGAAEVDDLRLGKAGAGQIQLSWNASCLATDTDHAVYEGTLGNFTSHDPRFCSTAGATTKTLSPPAGNAYYLVVPRNDSKEGSYGKDGDGDQRPVSLDACLPQRLAACP